MEFPVSSSFARNAGKSPYPFYNLLSSDNIFSNLLFKILTKIPIKYPVTIAAINNNGKYTYIRKSLIMKAATSSWPTL